MKFWREIAIVLLLAILAAVFFKGCEDQSFAIDNYNAMTDKVQHYQNRLHTQSASIKTLQLGNSELKEVLLKKNDTLSKLTKEFNKLHSIIYIGSRIKLPEIGVKLNDQLPNQQCDSIVSFERKGRVNEKWYSFNFMVTNDSLKLSQFTIPNNTTVITGVKRKWFLGKQTVTTDVTHSNPYVYTDNIQAAEVIIPEPWYKKWYLWLAAGIAGGLILK